MRGIKDRMPGGKDKTRERESFLLARPVPVALEGILFVLTLKTVQLLFKPKHSVFSFSKQSHCVEFGGLWPLGYLFVVDLVGWALAVISFEQSLAKDARQKGCENDRTGNGRWMLCSYFCWNNAPIHVTSCLCMVPNLSPMTI